MAIEELLRVVVPPTEPVEQGNPELWARVQEALGCRLPRDYYDFGRLYGTGEFSVGLTIWNPFGANFVEQVRTDCEWLRDFRGLVGRHSVPYGIFPDRPGWLPCGSDTLGNIVCWVTDGEPDDWPILLITHMCHGFQQVDLSLTSYLARLCSGRLTTIFGDSETDSPPAVHFLPEEPSPLIVGDERKEKPQETPKGGLPEGGEAISPQIEWLGPDSLGRPLGVRALLGQQPVSFPYEPFTFYPDWWDQLPGLRTQWVRHHLLGWRLGGPGGTARHNLVPLTWGAHHSMFTNEAALASVVKYECLIYTVQLEYAGTNPYPHKLIASAAPPPGSGSEFRFYTEVWNYPGPPTSGCC